MKLFITPCAGEIMTNIGSVTLGSIPRVVLAVGEYSDDFKSVYALGVSILEIRIDLFQKTDSAYIRSQLEQFKKIGLPLMATLRHESEGGKLQGVTVLGTPPVDTPSKAVQAYIVSETKKK